MEAHTEAPCGAVGHLHMASVGHVVGVDQETNSRSGWKSFFQELEAFRHEVRALRADPGYVASGSGKRCYATRRRIFDDRDDDRNHPRGLLRRLAGAGVGGNDDINIGPDCFGGESREVLGTPSSPAVVDVDGPTFDIAKLPEALPKGVGSGRVLWRGSREKRDAGDFTRRLRPGGKRRGEEAARQGADEGSSVHHSIT